jgi:hypothetical protein
MIEQVKTNFPSASLRLFALKSCSWDVLVFVRNLVTWPNFQAFPCVLAILIGRERR